MIEMYHPELDATITVNERVVEHYETKGWRRTDASDEPETVPERGEEEEE